MTDKARILFVDDEKRVLNSMRGLFRREYELFLTCEGSEAIKIAAENEIDVIVADQRMPGMTGVEVLAKMKEKSPRTVRILLTGYADPSAVEGSINIGEVFRFLSKPCPPKLLRETLTQAISASRTQPVAATALPKAAPAPQARPMQPAAPGFNPETPAAKRAALAPTPPQQTLPSITPPQAPAPQATPAPVTPAAAAPPSPPDNTLHDNDDTQPSLLALDEATIKAAEESSESHWQSVTNVVMSEDTVEETSENLALTSHSLGIKDVGVVVFTIDSDFATTAIRAVSTDLNTVLATSLTKVAQAITQQNTGVLVTDFTTNKTTLQRIISALKKHMPELVTIVVSSGRDTTDMINLINYGQVFRYVLKPIEPEELRKEIQSAAVRHLYLLNNPDSAKRHDVLESPDAVDTSSSINQFIGDVRRRRPGRVDPSDTFS
jgi:DNA-binding NtrC family response regulator